MTHNKKNTIRHTVKFILFLLFTIAYIIFVINGIKDYGLFLQLFDFFMSIGATPIGSVGYYFILIIITIPPIVFLIFILVLMLQDLISEIKDLHSETKVKKEQNYRERRDYYTMNNKSETKDLHSKTKVKKEQNNRGKKRLLLDGQ